MEASLLAKLSTLAERYDEIAALLSDPEIINNQNRYRELSKEYANLEDIIKAYQQYQQTEADRQGALSLQSETDPELKAMAEEEIQQARTRLEALSEQLQILLLPQDPNDERNIYLEIRAGTGGDEAALFSGDLFRMYSRYAEKHGWAVETLSTSEGEHGGFKEIIAKLSGRDVYGHLKFESGAHRVQRVPATESQGRIHTSACTVAILPEVETVDEVSINSDEIRVDTFRASGAGGQHVNKTDSAIRITHLPTGTVVECQEERSQHKNRAKAMTLLQSKLLSQIQAEQQAAEATTRRNLVGSGDRSERIRTYNYPQGRLTDHRINLTLYKLEDILSGDVDQVIEPLRREHQADQLLNLNDHG